MRRVQNWLVRLSHGPEGSHDFVRIISAPHASAAIQTVLAEYDTGDLPLVKVQAEAVNA